jgi:cardiolipin synthase A/B
MVLAITGVVFEIAGIICAALAVMKGRTPQGTIAWVAALIFMPFIAVPVFAMFGAHRFDGYVRARRRGTSTLSSLVRVAYELMKPYRELGPGVDRRASGEVVAEMFDSLPACRGNATRLLIDGEATFAAIFKAIDAAEHSVLVQFFIVNDDRLGRHMLDRLLAARKRGVEVYFLYDSIGSKKLTRDYTKTLARAGVRVRAFKPSRAPRFRLQVNFRNHRKVLVVDGRVAFLGGHNVGDEYMGQDPSVGPWRDTHLEIQGPAVQAAQMSFVEDWYCVTQQLPELDWHPKPVEGAKGRIAIVATGPADELETGVLLFMHLIGGAHRRLWIATPYFVPDSGVLSALQAAAIRGVDVRILVPQHPDHPVVHVAAASYYEDALRAGIRVFKYQRGFMHQKVVLSDNIAMVGSANLDNRSMRINFEISAVCDHANLAEEVAAMLETDLTRCREMSLKDFEHDTWLRQLSVRLARLAAPIL